MKKPLGQVIGELERMSVADIEQHDSIDFYSAPAECHTLVRKAFDKQVAAWFDANRLTARQLLDELTYRGVPESWLFKRLTCWGTILEVANW